MQCIYVVMEDVDELGLHTGERIFYRPRHPIRPLLIVRPMRVVHGARLHRYLDHLRLVHAEPGLRPDDLRYLLRTEFFPRRGTPLKGQHLRLAHE